MGGVQSTLVSGEGYAQRADKAKHFADSLLTLFFTKANLKRLLNLHDMKECSSFVFTTAEDLQTQFEKIQISPKLGKKGEIMFAPSQEIIPGLMRPNATNAESVKLMAELTHSRNEKCIHVAYFYVRVFQIYAALALTVINANPTRRSSSRLSSGAPTVRRSSLVGGGLRSQHGGAIPKTGKYGSTLRNSIIASPMAVLVSFLDPVGEPNSSRQVLRLSDTRSGIKGNLFIVWTYPTSGVSDITLEGNYQKTNGAEISTSINVRRDGNMIVFSLAGPNGSITQGFAQGIDQVWGFKYEAGEGTGRNDPIPFYDSIHEVFADEDDVQAGTSTGATYPGATSYSGASGAYGASGASGASGPYAPSGPLPSGGTSSATAFDGFKKLKDLFEVRSKGAQEFPKTYCVARAMTLLNPIFGNERADQKQPYYSQICRRTYDFESGEALMPRAGMSAKTNIYLRSLVSLYYDDYKYDSSKKTIKLTQTESGRSELRELSREFASLYMMPTLGAETFLAEDDDKSKATMTQFRDITVCAKKDLLIRIDQDSKGIEFIETLQSQVITPMLNFQEQHTIQVNRLLMKMFRIETITPKGGNPEVNLKLTDAVKSRGTEGVNAFGREAHKLLREYYRKSEAFYMKGVLMFEKNPGAWKT